MRLGNILAIILILFILGNNFNIISDIMYVVTGYQELSIQIVNKDGIPISDVSIQGLIPLPPNLGGDIATIFLGRTDVNGFFIISNLTSLRDIAWEWVKYLGSDIVKYSSPNILLFITYNSSDGIYFAQDSIDVNIIQLANGLSIHKEIVLEPASVLKIGHPRMIKKVKLNNMSTHTFNVYSNGFNFLLDLPISKPYEDNPEYFAWFKVDSDKWPSSGYGKIPLAWINASSQSYG